MYRPLAGSASDARFWQESTVLLIETCVMRAVGLSELKLGVGITRGSWARLEWMAAGYRKKPMSIRTRRSGLQV